MKNRAKYLILLIMAVSFSSCQEKFEPYNNETNRIGFNFVYRADSMTKYTFVYEQNSFVEDTIWVDLNTLGYIENFDRPVKIVQIPTGDDKMQAKVGQHYLSFDDPSIVNHFKVPAGANKISIPIVAKRDPSLKNGKYYLKLKIEKNEYFDSSYPTDNEKLIEISDIITKPDSWGGAMAVYFAGDYGDVKFQFMIDVADWKLDNEWFDTNFKVSSNIDMGYTSVLSGFFSEQLRILNKQRVSEGKDYLREKPVKEGVEGKLVQFKLNGRPLPVI